MSAEGPEAQMDAVVARVAKDDHQLLPLLWVGRAGARDAGHLDASTRSGELSLWLRSSYQPIVAERARVTRIDLPQYEGIVDARYLAALPNLERITVPSGATTLLGADVFRRLPLHHLQLPNGVLAASFAHPDVPVLHIWAERSGGPPIEADLSGFRALRVLTVLSTRPLRLRHLPPTLRTLDVTGVVALADPPPPLERAYVHGAPDVLAHLPDGLGLLRVGAYDELPLEAQRVPAADVLVLVGPTLPAGSERARVLHWRGATGNVVVRSPVLERLMLVDGDVLTLELRDCPRLRELELFGQRDLRTCALDVDHELLRVRIEGCQLRQLRWRRPPARLRVGETPRLRVEGPSAEARLPAADLVAPTVAVDPGELKRLRQILTSPDPGIAHQCGELLRAAGDEDRAMALFRGSRLERWSSPEFPDVAFWQLRHRLMMKGPYAETALLRVLAGLRDPRFDALRCVPALRVRETGADLRPLAELPRLASLAVEDPEDLGVLARLAGLRRLALRGPHALDVTWVPGLEHLGLVPDARLHGAARVLPLRSLHAEALTPFADHPTLAHVSCVGSADLDALTTLPALRSLRVRGVVRSLPALPQLTRLSLGVVQEGFSLDLDVPDLTLHKPLADVTSLARARVRTLTLGFVPDGVQLEALARMPCLERLVLPVRPFASPLPAVLEEKTTCA